MVPPEVTGVRMAKVDELVRLLLEKPEEYVGCRFTIEDGPDANSIKETSVEPSSSSPTPRPASSI